MYCYKCGFQLEDGANFCLKCGAKNIKNDLKHKKVSPTVSNASPTYSNITTTGSNVSPTGSQINSKKISTKKSKIGGGFIIIGVVLVLLSIGFVSYYISLSKLISSNANKPTIKKKLVPNNNIANKDTNTKSDVPASPKETDANKINSPNYYFFPKSGNEKLLDSDVSLISKENLPLARNEIYARHGLIFKGETFKNYFKSKSWYTENPNYKGTDKELNDAEVYNVQLIKKYESN